MKSTPVSEDAERVDARLAGNREAFAQIVSRYQSLVCSLAYNATGSPSQSEDLAHVNTQFVRQLWESNPFFQVCWKVVPHFFWLMWLWGVPIVLAMIAQGRAKARKLKPVAN